MLIQSQPRGRRKGSRPKPQEAVAQRASLDADAARATLPKSAQTPLTSKTVARVKPEDDNFSYHASVIPDTRRIGPRRGGTERDSSDLRRLYLFNARACSNLRA
jgi:hypothetical protein